MLNKLSKCWPYSCPDQQVFASRGGGGGGGGGGVGEREFLGRVDLGVPAISSRQTPLFIFYELSSLRMRVAELSCVRSTVYLTLMLVVANLVITK